MTPARKIFLLLSVLVLLSVSCSKEKIPGGRIIVRNDILDKEYNVFFVDQIVSANGMVPFRKSLSPGEQFTLPYKNIRKLRFIRQYADHAKVYQVTCPASLQVEVVMKLIDVHTNRLGGGCSLTKRGTMNKGGIVTWEP